jgi:hypothetical protein
MLSKYRDPPPGSTLEFLLREERDALLSRVCDNVREKACPSPKDVAMTSGEFRACRAVRNHRGVIRSDDDGAIFYSKPSRDWSATTPPDVFLAPRDARCSVIAEVDNAANAAHLASVMRTTSSECVLVRRTSILI